MTAHDGPRHGSGDSIGVLLTNLGTPDAPNKSAVRAYLKDFLSDPRVMKLPKSIWLPILHLFVLNTRPKKSAKAYAKIWTAQGSPLLTISQLQAKALQAAFQAALLAASDQDKNVTINRPIKVMLAMRYGSPSIKHGLDALQASGVKRILVFPLYPQYSATTTASTYDAVSKALKQSNDLPELRFINRYHDNPGYILALANSVRAFWAEHGRGEKLLMSFHGLPQDYSDAGDPYFHECQRTGALLAEALALDASQWVLSFQSRLGPKKWLSPYTNETLKKLAVSGTKKIDIICPGFSADCLETLEEMAVENRDEFLQAGGEQYHYIACLNDSPEHIDMLKGITQQHLQGWLE